MAAQDIITPEEIKRLFHYCENIGIFTRIVATGTRAKCARCEDKGSLGASGVWEIAGVNSGVNRGVLH